MLMALVSNAQIQITGVSATGETCTGECDGTVTISVSGASGPVVYSLNGVVQTVGVYSNLCPGSYDLTVTDGMTSDTQNGIVVDAYTSLNAQLFTFDETVAGLCDGMATLNITGGVPPYTITWYDGAMNILMSGTSSSIMPLCAGNYHYQVQDNSSCFGINPIIPFTIGSQAQPLLFTVTLTSPLCNGDCNGSINFSASGGAGGYEYSVDGITYSSNPVIGGLCAGTYNPHVRDQSSMTVSNGTVTLTEPSSFVATLIGQTDVTCNNICNGGAVIMGSGGTLPYAYMHPTLGTPMMFTSVTSINQLCFGPLMISVNDDNGCAFPVNGMILGPTAIVVTASSTDAATSTSCDGALSATVSGGTSPYTVYWKDCVTGAIAHTPPNPTVVCAGSYYAFVSDVSGCVDSSTCVTVSFSSDVANQALQQIKAWPNPTNQMLYLEMGNSNGNTTVEIMDAAGRKVHQGVLVNGINTIDMKSVAQSSGLYLVRVTTESGAQVLRIALE